MITITKELITPEIALKILENNTSNRRIRKESVQFILNQMLKGKWKIETGDTIKISKSGKLLDGQHRLTALVQSGLSFSMYVARDLEDDVFSVLDTGLKRNATDVFYIEDIRNANKIPSMIAFYNNVKSGSKHQTRKFKKSSNTELLEQYKINPEFWQEINSTATSLYLHFNMILPTSFIGGFYAYLTEIHRSETELFFNELCTGRDITNNVVILLRDILIKDKISSKKMNITHKMALLIKAWNCYFLGRELKRLYYNPLTESFPEIYE